MQCSTLLDILRGERLKRGYSQSYMAYKLNISQGNYSKMENGTIPMNCALLCKAGDVLNYRFFADDPEPIGDLDSASPVRQLMLKQVL